MNTPPPIGIGTSELKGSVARDAVHKALAGGYRHIDTARLYGNEDEVGRALKASGVPRQEVWITTKVWPDKFDDVQSSLDSSLHDLGVDRVDLLHAHWPKPEWTRGDLKGEQMREQLTALMRQLQVIRQSGKAHWIGLSNFPRELMLLAHSLVPVDAIQVEAHPQLYQPDLVAAAHAHGIHVQAYAPLGSGRGVLSDPIVADTAHQAQITPAQAALAWVLRLMDSTPPRSVDPAHQQENLKVKPGMLTPEQTKRLSDHATQTRRRYFGSPGLAPNWDWAPYAKG